MSVRQRISLQRRNNNLYLLIGIEAQAKRCIGFLSLLSLQKQAAVLTSAVVVGLMHMLIQATTTLSPGVSL
jgi:hypothetical protein